MSNGAYIFDSNENCPASVFRKYIGYLFTNGVFDDALAVTSGGGMNISVAAGYAHINGAVIQFMATQTIGIPAADSGQDRIDAIVVECDENSRKITIKAVTGELSSGTPFAPTVVRTDGVYQIMIAQISVNHGVTEITTSNIADTRSDARLCGFVAGRTRDIDFGQITRIIKAKSSQNLTDYVAEFDYWYENDYLKNPSIPQEELYAANNAISESREFIQTAETDIPTMESSIDDIMDTAQVAVGNKNSSQTIFFDISEGQKIEIPDTEYQNTEMLIISGIISSDLSESFDRRGNIQGQNFGTDFTMYAFKNFKSSASTDVFRAWACIENTTYSSSSANNSLSGQYDFLVNNMLLTFTKSTQTNKWNVTSIEFSGQLNTYKYAGTPGATDGSNNTMNVSAWGSDAMLKYNSIDEFNSSGGPFTISTVEAIVADIVKA